MWHNPSITGEEQGDERGREEWWLLRLLSWVTLKYKEGDDRCTRKMFLVFSSQVILPCAVSYAAFSYMLWRYWCLLAPDVGPFPDFISSIHESGEAAAYKTVVLSEQDESLSQYDSVVGNFGKLQIWRWWAGQHTWRMAEEWEMIRYASHLVEAQGWCFSMLAATEWNVLLYISVKVIANWQAVHWRESSLVIFHFLKTFN